jgi:hypothetical protein
MEDPMRSRSFRVLTMCAFLAGLLAASASAAVSACAETLTAVTDEGTITAHLIGEESNSVTIAVLLPPLFLNLDLEYGVGYYRLPDGGVMLVSCVSISV